MQLRQIHRVPTPRASLHTPLCFHQAPSASGVFMSLFAPPVSTARCTRLRVWHVSAVRCNQLLLCFDVMHVQPPPLAQVASRVDPWQYQVNLMSLVPMLVAACVAHAAASAATDASWRCWQAMAMGDTPALMKELGEVVCAVSSRCFASSGVSQMEQSFCAGTTEKLVAPKCCARAI